MFSPVLYIVQSDNLVGVAGAGVPVPREPEQPGDAPEPEQAPPLTQAGGGRTTPGYSEEENR